MSGLAESTNAAGLARWVPTGMSAGLVGAAVLTHGRTLVFALLGAWWALAGALFARAPIRAAGWPHLDIEPTLMAAVTLALVGLARSEWRAWPAPVRRCVALAGAAVLLEAATLAASHPLTLGAADLAAHALIVLAAGLSAATGTQARRRPA